MKKPPVPAIRRPAGVARRAPRTRAEAAVELVRLEFDRARLEREIAQADRRAALARSALDAGAARAEALVGALSDRKDIP